MSLCLHWPIIVCNHALLPSKRAAEPQWSATHDCTLEAMRTQGALSKFMRNTPLTTEHPTSDRMLGRSDGIDSGIRADLP